MSWPRNRSIGKPPLKSWPPWSRSCSNRFKPAASASRPPVRLRTPTTKATQSPVAKQPSMSFSPCAGSSASTREPQMLPSSRARQIGGRVVALTMPIFADTNMSLGTYCALWLIPGWREIMTLPVSEKTAKLRDPAVRASMLAAAKGTPFERRSDFGSYSIGDTVAPENKQYEGRLVSDIARERGIDSWNALIDIEEADGYMTVLWPSPAADSAEDWDLRRNLWNHEDVLLGGSDAGAHLDRLLGSPYPTRFLADTLRGRRLVTLERAVQLMTDVPARLFGLRDRGRLVEGAYADIVVFDPEEVDGGTARRVHDLPGQSLRLTAPSYGVRRVLVNGIESVVDGEPTGTLAGTVLPSV